MQISNVLAGWADPAAVAKRNDPLEAASAGGEGRRRRRRNVAGQPRGPGADPRQVRRAADHAHRVRRDDPEASEGRRDHRRGVPGTGRYPPRPGVGQVEGRRTGEPHGVLREKIKDAQRQSENADTPSARTPLKPLLRRLEWIEKFSVIQSNPGAAGVDAIA